MAFGPAVGLELVDRLKSDPALKNYHLLPGTRGDPLAKLSRFDEAPAAFELAASLTQNRRECELLRKRATECVRAAAEAEGTKRRQGEIGTVDSATG